MTYRPTPIDPVLLPEAVAEALAAPFPFRTEPAASDDPTAEQALGFLSSLRRATQDRLAAISVDVALDYVGHPDERVAVLATDVLRSRLEEARSGVRDYYGRLNAVAERAVGEADREGVLWTPRLEAFVQGTRATPRREFREAVPRGRFEQREIVAQWVDGCADPDLLHRLATAFPSLWGEIASRARSLRPDTVRLMLLMDRTDDHRIGYDLENNPDLNDEAVVELARFAVDPALVSLKSGAGMSAHRIFQARQEVVLRLAPELFGMAVDRALEQQLKYERANDWIPKLTLMPEAPWRRYLEARMAAIRADRPGHAVGEMPCLVAHPQTPPEIRRECWALAVRGQVQSHFMHNLGNRKAVVPGVTAFLEEILPECLDGTAITTSLARVWSLSEAGLQRALEIGDMQDIREALLENVALLQTPTAGHCLLVATDRKFLSRAVQTVAVPAWVRFRLLQTILVKWPKGGVEFLAQIRGAFPGGVPAEVFTPMFTKASPGAVEHGLCGIAQAWVRQDLPMPPMPPKPRITRRPEVQKALAAQKSPWERRRRRR